MKPEPSTEERRFGLEFSTSASLLAIGAGMLVTAARPDWMLPIGLVAASAVGLRRLARASDPTQDQPAVMRSNRTADDNASYRLERRGVAGAGLAVLLGVSLVNLLLLSAATVTWTWSQEYLSLALWLTTVEVLAIWGTALLGRLRRDRRIGIWPVRVSVFPFGLMLGLVSVLVSRFLLVDFTLLVALLSTPGAEHASAGGSLRVAIAMHSLLFVTGAIVMQWSGAVAVDRRHRMLWETVAVAAVIGAMLGFLLGLPASWAALLFATWSAGGQLTATWRKPVAGRLPLPQPSREQAKVWVG